LEELRGKWSVHLLGDFSFNSHHTSFFLESLKVRK
jgi:hypothetical protein